MEDWTLNYFNYFTEIEEHFQRARGTGLFLLSPLDWALIENWRTADIPLEAVIKGIDQAFENWRSRKRRYRMINSLAYCSQAVLEAANKTRPERGSGKVSEAPFTVDELTAYLNSIAGQLKTRAEQPLQDVAISLVAIAGDAPRHMENLEALEQRLSALEEKLVASLRASQTEGQLLETRQALDAELQPYRSKMTADQIAMLERRYLDSALLQRLNVPRLSLFYIH